MECMVDIETLGTKATAPVKSIGAVFFDLETGKLGDTFYRVLKLDPQFKKGRLPDEGALKFWMKQGLVARDLFETESFLPTEVLSAFIFWFQHYKDAFVWGNGSSFDISILESLLNDFDLQAPWSYKQIVDYRTFKRFCYKSVDIERIKGTEHHALNDAIAQANFVIENYKRR